MAEQWAERTLPAAHYHDAALALPCPCYSVAGVTVPAAHEVAYWAGVDIPAEHVPNEAWAGVTLPAGHYHDAGTTLPAYHSPIAWAARTLPATHAIPQEAEVTIQAPHVTEHWAERALPIDHVADEAWAGIVVPAGHVEFPADSHSHVVTLSVGGVVVDHVALSVTMGEGAALISCSVELATPEDFARFSAINAPFTITIEGTPYSFIRDTRARSAGFNQDGYTITGLSTGAASQSPRATPVTQDFESGTTANAAAELLLGYSIDWQIIDWAIPAFRLSVSDASPLDAAKIVAEAVGGLVEQNPDGTWKARYRWPVAVNTYSSAGPDHVLTSIDDVILLNESVGFAQEINRIRIVDVNASYSDRVEFTSDEDSGLSGVLRVYPSPWRDDVTIETTNGVLCSLSRVGSSSRSISGELVEFVAGSSSAQYPVVTISAIDWESDNLGGILHAGYSAELQAVNGGYSLARIDYSTKYIEYRVTALAGGNAQFLVR